MSEDEQLTTEKGGVPYEVKRKLNWGAFFLTWIWGIGNKVWIALLGLIPVFAIIVIEMSNVKFFEMSFENRVWTSIIFVFSPVSGIIALLHKSYMYSDFDFSLWDALTIVAFGLAVQIYLLIKGNELAWNSRKYDSVEHFFKVQRKWLIVGLVIGVINIILFMWFKFCYAMYR